MAAAIRGWTELVLSGFKCLDAIKHHLMIMEVTEAIGKNSMCLSVERCLFLANTQHGDSIANFCCSTQKEHADEEMGGKNPAHKWTETRKSFLSTFSNVAPDFALHRSFTMSRPLRCYFWLPVCGSGLLRFHASVKIGWGFGSNQIGHKHPQHHLLGKGSGVKGRTLYSDKWIFNLLNYWLTPL